MGIINAGGDSAKRINKKRRQACATGYFPVYEAPTDPVYTYEDRDDRSIQTATAGFSQAIGLHLEGVVSEAALVLTSHTPEYLEPDVENNGFRIINNPPVGTSLRGTVSAVGFKSLQLGFELPETPGSYERVNNFLDGSLAKHSDDWVKGFMTSGATPDTDVFSAADYNTKEFTRNPNHWLADSGLDFTGCVVATSARKDGKLGGALVTPDVVDFSEHFGFISPGTDVYFVDANNAVISRNVVAIESLDDWDIRLALLDSPVPPEFKVYEIAGDLSAMMSKKTTPPGGPACVYLDGNDGESVYYYGFSGHTNTEAHGLYQGEYYSLIGAGVYSLALLDGVPYPPGKEFPINGQGFEDYSKVATSGDSGSPVFLIEGGRLVFVFRLWSPLGGRTAPAALYNAAIARMEQRVGEVTGQTVTTATITGYNEY